jgi:hypothetical protein
MTAAHCASRLWFAAAGDLTGRVIVRTFWRRLFENALFEEKSTPVKKRVSRKRRNF